MTRAFGLLCLCLLVLGFGLHSQTVHAQEDPSIRTFWDKFRAAVINKDKHLVADLSRYPITMPYGLRTVRTRAQLVKRYREVFNHDSDAAICFAEAKPVVDAARPNEFTVGCKNGDGAGDEVVIYSFIRTKAGWRFGGLDNLNE
ncbi:MAG TPA: hypothetical protein VJS64_11490 [Pyrinomonadaceae bacterium]|nr:hypothetical protein [Pyrinomonadaceae bacterium]